ncbi:hypothetical protein DL764_008690 [Monosporascus ibericus]|uniref:Ketoreductase (KR) domain-containing protein n=1 Tax=Monosporascus ibericus TaxID=155417 RepID=A0A4Q4SZP1_9PEZI|nr:hypothetical protein DL764_008690 [Monosporascus ibericus]
MAVTVKGTILVTGANGGLGSAIAHQFASKSELSAYHGLYAVRDTSHAPVLTSALAHGATHPYDVVALDLTRLDNVRVVAEGINARVSAGEIPPIRALILNAGFLDFGKQTWTAHGLENTFAANYLGHWLLTLLLLKSMDKQAGRIVVIGSQAHNPKDPRNAMGRAFVDPKYQTIVTDAARFEAISKGSWSPDASFQGGFRRYGVSKLFLIMMQHELQARLNADPTLSNICILGVDPGTMVSGLQRLAPWVIRVLIHKIIYTALLWLNPNNGLVRPTSGAAADVLEAAFGTQGGELPKDKYFDGRSPFETSEESRDTEKRELVWKETVKLAGLKDGETVLTTWQICHGKSRMVRVPRHDHKYVRLFLQRIGGNEVWVSQIPVIPAHQLAAADKPDWTGLAISPVMVLNDRVAESEPEPGQQGGRRLMPQDSDKLEMKT